MGDVSLKTSAGKYVRFDGSKIIARVITIINNNNIQSDADLDTYIDGLTDAQVTTAVRIFLKGLITVTSTP